MIERVGEWRSLERPQLVIKSNGLELGFPTYLRIGTLVLGRRGADVDTGGERIVHI
jgi:hypothetical protein